MAAGDVTYDTGAIRSAGDHYVITGSIEADTTARAFVLAPTSRYLLWCNLECTTDDATNDTRSTINTTEDFSTAQNGTVGVQAEAADTFKFEAGLI
jgi:hypothetical protein